MIYNKRTSLKYFWTELIFCSFVLLVKIVLYWNILQHTVYTVWIGHSKSKKEQLWAEKRGISFISSLEQQCQSDIFPALVSQVVVHVKYLNVLFGIESQKHELVYCFVVSSDAR